MSARKVSGSGRAASLKQKLQAASGIKRKGEVAHEAPKIVVSPGREGRKAIAIYMQPLAKDQLARIAHEQKKSIQELGVEAINLLFRHYDLKPIA